MGKAALTSAIQPFDYVGRNTYYIFAKNPTDSEVYRYGKELGNVLQAVAGSSGAYKILSKVSSKLVEFLKKLPNRFSKGKGNAVYISKNSKGVVQYVGITNNLARRAAEHLRTKGIRIEPLMKGLSRNDAKAVEQALIEIHGLQKNGGSLINKINSISKSNPNYAKQLKRGYELLKSVGYK